MFNCFAKASFEATSGTPGPVNLQLVGKHGDIEDDSADLELIVEDLFSRVPAVRPIPDNALINDAARLLRAAQRPVMVVGGEQSPLRQVPRSKTGRDTIYASSDNPNTVSLLGDAYAASVDWDSRNIITRQRSLDGRGASPNRRVASLHAAAQKLRRRTHPPRENSAGNWRLAARRCAGSL
jgi:hypothetical protein